MNNILAHNLHCHCVSTLLKERKIFFILKKAVKSFETKKEKKLGYPSCIPVSDLLFEKQTSPIQSGQYSSSLTMTYTSI